MEHGVRRQRTDGRGQKLLAGHLASPSSGHYAALSLGMEYGAWGVASVVPPQADLWSVAEKQRTRGGG